MSCHSPGRVLEEQPSVLNLSCLDDGRIVKALTCLQDLLLSSYGPLGHPKLLHNNCGGEVTLTSDSECLLQTLCVSKPVIKLIISAILDHVRLYSDGGLLTATLSLQLILDALKLDIHRHLIVEIYDLLLKDCVNFMESDKFPCKVNIGMHNEVQRKIIRNMFTSKPACLLFGAELDHVCDIVLEVYTESHTREDHTLMYVTVPGRPVLDSRLLHGVLYACPQIPPYSRTPLHVIHHKGLVRTALVQTSMAGDTEAFLDVTYEITSDLHLSDMTLTQLEEFTMAAVEAEVGVIVCQKVVHPTVTKLCKQHGLLVLDRLGRSLFTAVSKLTGGQVLDPYSVTRVWRFSSVLSGLHHVVINKQSYIHMESVAPGGGERNTPSSVSTVLLSHRTLHSLDELKRVFERCRHVLGVTCKRDVVLCGAGCWQTALCLHLNNLPAHKVNNWTEVLDCSKVQLTQVLQMFISAITYSVSCSNHTDPYSHLVDTTTGHHFLSDGVVCQCGAVSYNTTQELTYMHVGHAGKGNWHCGNGKDEQYSYSIDANNVDVVDPYLTVVSALRTSIAVSSMVLGIHNYIEDTN